jgi:hypothetical protein
MVSRTPDFLPSVSGCGLDTGFDRFAMSNETLTKLIVTVIVVISMTVWLALDRHDGCTVDCPTDISAQRR